MKIAVTWNLTVRSEMPRASRDLLVGQPGRDQTQHAALARREQAAGAAPLGDVPTSLAAMRGLRYDAPAWTWRIASRDLGRGRAFEQVAARAAADRAQDVVVGIVGGEDQDASAVARERGDAIDRVRVRQPEIEQHDVGRSLAATRRPSSRVSAPPTTSMSRSRSSTVAMPSRTIG